MPKHFFVDGHELVCLDDECSLDDIRNMFKDEVTVDDGEKWETKAKMQVYTAETFIEKSRYYLSLTPPDLVQTAEKLWLSAVFAVKELYLTAANIDIKSHSALSILCDFAICSCDFPFERRTFLLHRCWANAERLHQDSYGSTNFSKAQYPLLIDNIAEFVTTFAQMDRKRIKSQFEKTFIVLTSASVVVRKASGTVNLGGIQYKREFSVHA